MEAAMQGFKELARLLAAPSIAALELRREDEPRERNKPPEKSDEQQESPNLEEFEYIEVGDPRDGP
jgi:replicative DNA helicase